MKKSAVVLTALGAMVLGAVAFATRDIWRPPGAVAQAPSAPAARVVPVETAVAVKKMTPVRIEALGTVTPIENVAVRSRVDSEIIGVHFRDGAIVHPNFKPKA